MTASKTPKKREMAHAYVSGPEEVRGNWMEAGMTTYSRRDKVPKKDDEGVRSLIVELGGTPPPLSLEDMLEDITLPIPGDPKEQEQWQALAEQMMPIVKAIALGHMDSNATQKGMLDMIIKRGYKEDIVDDTQTIGVVVLPAIGVKSGLTVCPNCLSELEKE